MYPSYIQQQGNSEGDKTLFIVQLCLLSLQTCYGFQCLFGHQVTAITKETKTQHSLLSNFGLLSLSKE